jgi:hypothetical protein
VARRGVCCDEVLTCAVLCIISRVAPLRNQSCCASRTFAPWSAAGLGEARYEYYETAIGHGKRRRNHLIVGCLLLPPFWNGQGRVLERLEPGVAVQPVRGGPPDYAAVCEFLSPCRMGQWQNSSGTVGRKGGNRSTICSYEPLEVPQSTRAQVQYDVARCTAPSSALRHGR